MGDPLQAMWANMQTFYRLLGARAPGGSVLDRDGLVAAVVPSCPDLSVVNSVVYDDAEALRKARDELEAAYERAGVRAVAGVGARARPLRGAGARAGRPPADGRAAGDDHGA